MVKGTRSAAQVLGYIRKSAKARNFTVEKLPKRDKGSHAIWVVLDGKGTEVGRVGLAGHSGQQSQTVTRSNETALEELFGKGWLDK